jgi:hypothetical protein
MNKEIYVDQFVIKLGKMKSSEIEDLIQKTTNNKLCLFWIAMSPDQRDKFWPFIPSHRRRLIWEKIWYAIDPFQLRLMWDEMNYSIRRDMWGKASLEKKLTIFKHLTLEKKREVLDFISLKEKIILLLELDGVFKKYFLHSLKLNEFNEIWGNLSEIRKKKIFLSFKEDYIF